MNPFKGMPPQAVPVANEAVPEDVELPVLDIQPASQIPEDVGMPDIPMVPVCEDDHLPEEAKSAIDEHADFFDCF
ncbi:MAG: hypothetical protein GKR98_13565 [Boseongicola sp.]|nr:MAG: hypothetical protein GKR98_13565 [Boseongicola sp.]